jgi:hypothetical protein
LRRRINYTGRRRIPKEKVSIILNKDDHFVVRSFNVKINLEGFNFPPDAKIYIDAYHRTEVKRYDFGTAENIVPPRDSGLTGFAYPENLKFRILIVDESGQHGLILAHADRIKATSDLDTKSILPVDFDDIGQQIWRVDFKGDGGSPVLVINRHIPNIKTIVISDSQFIMYVYPAVIREVLTHMIFVEGVESPSDPSIEWHEDWLDFSRRILPGEGPPEVLDPQEADFEGDAAKEWINKVVEEFSASRNEWRKFINRISGEIEG